MTEPGHVLIVEDDTDVREMLVSLLGDEGFRAVAAEDGLEALHLLRTVRHHAPSTPCLVLLDLSMPRLGGHEFRRAQLADPIVAGVPVAIMSGAVDAEERGQSLGAVATLTKPLDVDRLLSLVRHHCAAQPQA
ncbi:MAG: response regulator [Vicinamibacterales bacterium]